MADQSTVERGELIKLVGEIVAAHVGNNATAVAEVPALLQAVFDKLRALAREEPEPADLVPAVSIRRSVTDDYIVCLEDGKKLKMLKRHLMTDHGLTPEAYRAKWSLRADYPMSRRPIPRSARRSRSRSAWAESRHRHPRHRSEGLPEEGLLARRASP